MSNGLSTQVFHLIWTPSDILSSTKSLHLNLPDTILFDKGQPLFWFYSKNGALRKKKRENVTLSNILERLKANLGGSGVCAYFISLSNEKNKGRQEIKYFKIDELYEFFDENINKFPCGFLQKFVEPYGSKNTLFQAKWSKNFVILTKGTNSKNINNRKINTFERCCTFDGPEMFSEKKSVSGKISSSLTELSNSLANHISSLTYGSMEIKTANFFFKQAENGSLYFLWASEVEFQKHSRSNFNKGEETPIFIPKNIEKRMTINLQKPLTLNKNVVCLMCGKENFNDQFTEVTYKEIIANQEKILTPSPRVPFSPASSFQKASLLEMKALFRLPPLFQKLYPRITPQNYHVLRESRSFLAQTIRICFSCFYVLIGEEKAGERKREEEVKKRREEEGSRWESEKKENGRNKGVVERMKEELIHPESKYFLYKGYDDYFTINDGLVNEMGGWGERKNCNGGQGIKMRELFSLEEGRRTMQEGSDSRRGSWIKDVSGFMEKKSERTRMEDGGGGKEERIRRLIWRKREEEGGGGSTRSTEDGEDFWDMYQDRKKLEKHLRRKNEKCIDILRDVRR